MNEICPQIDRKNGSKERPVKAQLIALLLQAVLVAGSAVPVVLGQDGIGKQPPLAKKIPHTREIHGYILKDDYFWASPKEQPGSHPIPRRREC